MYYAYGSVTSATKLFIAVVLATLAGCASAPPEESQSAPEPVTVTEPEPDIPARPAEPDKSGIRIAIASVGDMMIGTDFPENHLPDDDGVGFLEAVTSALSSSDITFGNLEGVLMDGGEPVKKCSNPNACYLFRSPTRYADYFRAAGFDVMSLANNHARDIHHSGREGDFASFEVNGLKIAVLAYAVTKESNMLLDYELARTTVAGFAASHDIVMVTFHGGAEGADVTNLPFAEEEYYGEPRGDVVMFARMVVDAGADLVIGHGPHVVRAMERYKDRLIAYSLGNFATYYGISVAGIKGIAPILLTTLDGEGRFIEGEIVSTVQIRPAGPSIDDQQRAYKLIRGLTAEDFENPGLTFTEDGRFAPLPIDVWSGASPQP